MSPPGVKLQHGAVDWLPQVRGRGRRAFPLACGGPHTGLISSLVGSVRLHLSFLTPTAASSTAPRRPPISPAAPRLRLVLPRGPSREYHLRAHHIHPCFAVSSLPRDYVVNTESALSTAPISQAPAASDPPPPPPHTAAPCSPLMMPRIMTVISPPPCLSYRR